MRVQTDTTICPEGQSAKATNSKSKYPLDPKTSLSEYIPGNYGRSKRKKADLAIGKY